MVSPERLAAGALYPAVSDLRRVSRADRGARSSARAATAEWAVSSTTTRSTTRWTSAMWEPDYLPYEPIGRDSRRRVLPGPPDRLTTTRRMGRAAYVVLRDHLGYPRQDHRVCDSGLQYVSVPIRRPNPGKAWIKAQKWPTPPDRLRPGWRDASRRARRRTEMAVGALNPAMPVTRQRTHQEAPRPFRGSHRRWPHRRHAGSGRRQACRHASRSAPPININNDLPRSQRRHHHGPGHRCQERGPVRHLHRHAGPGRRPGGQRRGSGTPGPGSGWPTT